MESDKAFQLRAGSIGVVESFYGEEISRELLAKIASTPIEQLLELADRLLKKNRWITSELFLRRSALKGESATASLFSISSQLQVHEDLYFDSSRHVSVADMAGFKHWFLYSESLVLPDPAFHWANELIAHEQRAPVDIAANSEWAAYGPRLAAYMTHHVQLRPLIECGGVVLVPDKHALFVPYDDETEIEPWMVDEISTFSSPNATDLGNIWLIGKRDPYLSWALVQTVLPTLPSWERAELEAEARIDPRAAAAALWNGRGVDEGRLVKDLYPYFDGSAAWLQLAVLARGHSLIPVPSSRLAREHLLRSSFVSLEGLAMSPTPPDHVKHAVHIGLPNLSTVTLDDLVRLRQNEELFARFRAAIVEVARIVADIESGDFSQLQREVQEAADSLVRPTYEELTRRSQSAKLRALIGGYASGAAVSLTLNGIVSLVSGPGQVLMRGAANVASSSTREKVRNRLAGRTRDIEIARSLLLSTLPPQVK